MSDEKKDKKVRVSAGERSQYTPHTRSYRVMLEKKEKPKEDKKD